MHTARKPVASKPSTIIYPERLRAILNETVAQNPGKTVTQGYIRVEQLISNGKTNYTFPVTKDSNSDSATERKLDRNDKFKMTHVGMFLVKKDSTLPSLEVDQTYPNIQVFPDESTTFYGAHLEVFYKGNFQIRIGQTLYVEALDTARFRVVGNTQQSSASTKSSVNPYDGYTELTPQITLDGDGKSQIQLSVPANSNLKVANTTTNMSNYVVFAARGFLITDKK